MNRRAITRLLLASPLLLLSRLRAQTNAASDDAPATTGTLLADLCKKHRLPGLAVCVTRDDRVRELAAAGLRRQSDPAPLTAGDRFHIGSCTKSMTATLAAILVKRGLLSWDMPLAEALPALRDRMHPDHAKTTLPQLLAHRGGLPGEAPPDLWRLAWEHKGPPARARAEFVAGLLTRPPGSSPGQGFEYSNQGYAVAGHVLETLAGRPWEELIREELFNPLGMTTAGFGPPGAPGGTDEPWGHRAKLGGRLLPDQSDNPPAIGPAGTVHCSLEDLSRYTRFHLRRGRGEPALLAPEDFARLHTPPPDNEDYASGWLSVKRGWAGGRALTHSGSNTLWFVVMWLAPERDFSVIAGANVAGPAAETACDEICYAMIQRHLAS